MTICQGHCASKNLTSDVVCPHSYTSTRNPGGGAVDALNTTYPSPLPDHRVLLTVVFVPCAHALASSPIWLHHDALLLHLRGSLGFSE